MFHVEIPECPKWVRKLLYLFRIRYYEIPVYAEKILDDYIEKENYQYAKAYLAVVEKNWGISTFTVKYATRISRMEILGK